MTTRRPLAERLEALRGNARPGPRPLLLYPEEADALIALVRELVQPLPGNNREHCWACDQYTPHSGDCPYAAFDAAVRGE